MHGSPTARSLLGNSLNVRHEILRSALLAPLLQDAATWADVGTGIGLPGLPLVVLCPGRGAVLIEPSRRSRTFLESAIRELDLEVELVPTSAEEAGRGVFRETLDVVLGRALAPFSVAAELCAPLSRVGGKIVLTGAPQSQPPNLGSRASAALGLGAPVSRDLGPAAEVDIRQRVHIIPKVSPTSADYPRRLGVPRQRPLR